VYLTNETALVVLGVAVLLVAGQAALLVRDAVRWWRGRGEWSAPPAGPGCGCRGARRGPGEAVR